MAETLNYSVIKKENAFELRQYPAHITAEVEVADISYQKAIYRGFSTLAGYIFGENNTSMEIAMTSPVQVGNTQKIAMTKPVTVSGDGIFVVAFIMPSEFTLETLPTPKNPAIYFNRIDPQTMATIRFIGFFREGKVRKAKQRLKQWLEKEKLETKGDFIVSRYNPPWVPWFLARNEVMVQIEV